MANGQAGRPRVLHRRLVRDATDDEREHEKEVAKAASDTAITKAVVKALGQRAPDLAILGGGFYLGAVMNMRPGLDIPVVGFLGFPDFGGRIKELKEEVKTQQENVDRQQAELVKDDEEEAACIAQANKDFMQHRDTFRLAADTKQCQERNLSKGLSKRLNELKGELRKHQIAQGILMATIIYGVTRPGFLQGVGEILPG